MAQPRVLIVGAGAVGGYFGARLAEAGRDVTFLVRQARATLIARDGLAVFAPEGDIRLHPQVVTAESVTGTFDLILLCVKAYGLDAAVDAFSAAVGSHSLILPTLNGMRHIDVLREAFGEDRLLGGVCVVAAELEEGGAVRRLYGEASLTYGRLQNTLPVQSSGPAIVDTELDRVDEVLSGVGFRTRRSNDIELDMWEKWTFLAAAGALTCLLRGNVGQIEAAPFGVEIARALVGECAAIAAAAGFPARTAFLQWTDRILTDEGSAFTTSMFRDLQRGAEVESDQIIGDLLARSRTLGVAAPLLAAAYTSLAVYQNARR